MFDKQIAPGCVSCVALFVAPRRSQKYLGCFGPAKLRELFVALQLELFWRDHPLGRALDELVADERARDPLCFGADDERRVVPVPTWGREGVSRRSSVHFRRA